MKKWLVVWGFSSTGSRVGVLDDFETREEADKRARELNERETNPACAWWVEKESD